MKSWLSEMEMMIVQVFLKVCEGTERKEARYGKKGFVLEDVCTLRFEEMRGCEQFKRKIKQVLCRRWRWIMEFFGVNQK